jgi:hypothetical protein
MSDIEDGKRWSDGTPRVPVTRCPHCGQKLDAASVLQGEVPLPEPDDLTVCFGCGEALQFDAKLRLRKMTAAELAALAPDEAAELRQTQQAIRKFLAS